MLTRFYLYNGTVHPDRCTLMVLRDGGISHPITIIMHKDLDHLVEILQEEQARMRLKPVGNDAEDDGA